MEVRGEEAMPRIAASLAVLLTVVTCIGFNTARYPRVWKMVARADDPAQTALPEPSVSTPQSTDAAEWEETLASPGASAPRWESDGSPRQEAPAWESTAPEPTSPSSYDDASCYSYDDSTATYPSGSYDGDSGASEGSSIGAEGLSGGYEDGQGRADRVAMRAPPGPMTAEASRFAGRYAADPVAPLHRSTSSLASGDDLGEGVAEGSGDGSQASDPCENVNAYASGARVARPRPPDAGSHASGDRFEGGVADGGMDDSDDALVPIAPSGLRPDATAPREGAQETLLASAARSLPGTSQVQRLPPVDRIATLASADPEPPATNGPPSAYPAAAPRRRVPQAAPANR
jgi:hypothetical protein